MKRVLLQRAWRDDRATIGMLSILGVKHDPIFSLENPARSTSVDSLIPAGEYLCSPYSGTRFKNVYQVKNVPGRTAILLHPGNFEKDTEGCILIGFAAGMSEERPAVLASRAAFDFFRGVIGREDFVLVVKD